MYRLNLVMEMHPDKKVSGGISVGRILDDQEMMEGIGADNITDVLNTKEIQYLLLPEESISFNHVSVERAFNALRSKFKSPLVNTNADVDMNIGDHQNDLVSEFIPRAEYLRTPDSMYVQRYLGYVNHFHKFISWKSR